jgi:ATP-dependent Zn protease
VKYRVRPPASPIGAGVICPARRQDPEGRAAGGPPGHREDARGQATAGEAGVPFFGGALTDTSHLSPHTQDTIDSEVQRIVDVQYERAQRLLTERPPALESAAGMGCQRSTIRGAASANSVS